MRDWLETALGQFGSFEQPLGNEQPPATSPGGFFFKDVLRASLNYFSHCPLTFQLLEGVEWFVSGLMEVNKCR